MARRARSPGSSPAEAVASVGRETQGARSATDRDAADLKQEAAEMSERVRRIALGLTAALVTARRSGPASQI